MTTAAPNEEGGIVPRYEKHASLPCLIEIGTRESDHTVPRLAVTSDPSDAARIISDNHAALDRIAELEKALAQLACDEAFVNAGPNELRQAMEIQARVEFARAALHPARERPTP